MRTDRNLDRIEGTVITPDRRQTRICAILLALFTLAGSPISVQAQEVFGTLRLLESGTPAAGVIVIARLQDTDSVIGRTLTGARGTYSLRVTTAPVVLSALRVGYAPFEIERITAQPGERIEASAQLPSQVARLAALSSRMDSRCHVNPGNGALVAQLFEEARKALWTSRLAASDEDATSLIQLSEQDFDSRDRPIGNARPSVAKSLSWEAFSSANTDSLLTNGFRTIGLNDEMTYFAPDARVLTDDRFLKEYCLRLRLDSVRYPDQIGVSFEPARNRRGVIQVRGTVWMDRVSHWLSRIEYGYVGLEPALTRATPGGTVDYTQLSDGRTFIHYWSIRMPRVSTFTRTIQGGSELEHVAVTGVKVSNGVLLELRSGEQMLFTAGEPDSASSALHVLHRDSLTCESTSDSTATSVRGHVRSATGIPLAGVLVRAKWVARIVDVFTARPPVYEEREVFSHTGEDGGFLLCGIARERTVTVIAAHQGLELARTAMRIRQGSATSLIELISKQPLPEFTTLEAAESQRTTAARKAERTVQPE